MSRPTMSLGILVQLGGWFYLPEADGHEWRRGPWKVLTRGEIHPAYGVNVRLYPTETGASLVCWMPRETQVVPVGAGEAKLVSEKREARFWNDDGSWKGPENP